MIEIKIFVYVIQAPEEQYGNDIDLSSFLDDVDGLVEASQPSGSSVLQLPDILSHSAPIPAYYDGSGSILGGGGSLDSVQNWTTGDTSVYSEDNDLFSGELADFLDRLPVGPPEQPDAGPVYRVNKISVISRHEDRITTDSRRQARASGYHDATGGRLGSRLNAAVEQRRRAAERAAAAAGSSTQTDLRRKETVDSRRGTAWRVFSYILPAVLTIMVYSLTPEFPAWDRLADFVRCVCYAALLVAGRCLLGDQVWYKANTYKAINTACGLKFNSKIVISAFFVIAAAALLWFRQAEN